MYTERSSNDSFIDNLNSTFSNATFQLAGNDFKDPILVSAIAVNGVCAVSFAILAITGCCIWGKKQRGRYAFGILTGLISAMFLTFVEATGVGVANELAANISSVSVILGLVRDTISNGSDTTLLFVVYSVISNRLYRVGGNSDRNETLRLIHLGTASITAILGYVDAGVGDYAQTLATAEGDDDDKAVNWAKLYGKIHLAYLSVYCSVALEILACAVFVYNQSNLIGRVSRISKYLVMMVTPFLVIRSIAALALGIIYVYLGRDEQKYTGLINAVTLGITAVIIYVGIVSIGLQKDWFSQDSVVSYTPVQQDRSGSAIMTPEYKSRTKASVSAQDGQF